MTFSFTGRTRTGELVRGERQAVSRDAAVAALRQEEILVTGIDIASDGATARWGWRRRAPLVGVAAFTRQLAVMVDAGVPLVDALGSLAEQEPHGGLRRAIQAVREDVEAGVPLSTAVERRAEAFDPLYASMVAAGEAGGQLAPVLDRLAVFIEKQVRLRSQLVSATTYPAAIIVVAGVVLSAILWKVIPSFSSLFDGLGATLPVATRVVIWLSESLLSGLPLLVMLLLGGGLALRRVYGTPAGRLALDGSLLRIPVVGAVLRKVSLARVCRTLATLLGAGIPILESLAITARTAGNAEVEAAVLRARTAIEGGASVSTPFRETPVFPPVVTQMVCIGETTGTLDAMFAKIADFYEEEVDASMKGMLTLLEPVMIALLGVVVGGIVVAMYLPIFDLIARMAG